MKLLFGKVGKGITYISLFVVIGCLVMLSICGERATGKIPSATGEMLRVHIIANDNTETDMQIKYDAREAMFEFFGERTENIHTKEEMIAMIERDKTELNESINKSLSESGAEYAAEISIARESFPVRMYGDTVVAAGDYDSVIITLGEGKGDNWWCVAFPSFCVTKKVENKENVVVKSRFAEFFDKIATFFKNL